MYITNMSNSPEENPNATMATNDFFKRFYLFIFREKGRDREREEEKHQCVVASRTPHNWRPGLQPRHVP